MYYDYMGVPVHYEIVGSGQPLLFLHGWGGEIDSFKTVIEKLKVNYRCICVDFLGFGKSGSFDHPLFLKNYCNQVLSLLNYLEIDSIEVVAHSFGCRVCMKIMGDMASDILNSCVLVAPAGLKGRFSIWRSFKVLLYKIKKMMWRMGLIKGEFIAKSGSSDYQKLGYIEKKTFVNIISEDLSACAKKIKKKVLLVYGEGDTAVPKYMVRKLSKLIVKSEVYSMSGAHFCYIENALETASLVREFFRES